MTTTLVYVHGTNGSGKSTLARAVLAASGGATEYVPSGTPSLGHTQTPAGVALVGRYTSQCGGVDAIHPYSLIHDHLLFHAIFSEASVFAEGLVTPGMATCKGFADLFDRAVFIALATPVEQCIENFIKRRKRMKPRKNMAPVFDPSNLIRKHQSAINWAANLERTGLEAYCLQYPEAQAMCYELLGLTPPSVSDLLGE